MSHQNDPLFVSTDENAPRHDLPFVEREAITALVRDPKNGKYLGLKWKEVNWETFIKNFRLHESNRYLLDFVLGNY